MALPKDVHIRIHKPYKYVALHVKRYFVSMIMLKIWRWVIILDYQDGPKVITGSFWEGGRWVRAWADAVTEEAEVGEMQGHKARNAGSLGELEKARKWILPQSPQQEHNPATHCGLSTSSW